MNTTTEAISPTQPMISHRESAALAATAYDRFAGVVESLDPGHWSHPTDCSLWTVRDMVGHMVGAMRSAASLRELVSQQREITARQSRGEGNETDVMTQVQIQRTASLSTAELTRECRALVSRAAAGRRRTPAPLRRFVRFPVTVAGGTETWTLGYLVDVILTRDAWMHRVDLARATGTDLEVTSEHDGRIVADVVAEWGRRHGLPFELTLTGPAGGVYTSGERGESLEMDAVEFCRTVSGRVSGFGLLAVQVPF